MAELFRYRGVRQDGKHCRGQLMVRDRAALQQQLIEQGIVLLSARRNVHTRRIMTLSSVDLLKLTTQFSESLSAGLSLERAVIGIIARAKSKHWLPVLEQLHIQLKQGEPLSNAAELFPDAFPNRYVTMLKIAEQTGNYAAIFKILVAQLTLQIEQRKQLVKAIRYPLFLVTISLLVVVAMLTWLVPKFSDIYTAFGKTLPDITLTLLAVSKGVGQYGIWLLLILVVMAICLSQLVLKSFVLRRLVYRLPVIGWFFRTRQQWQFFFSMDCLLNAGIPIYQALDMTIRETSCPVYQRQLIFIQQELMAGGEFYVAMSKSTWFTRTVNEVLAVGAETGEMGKQFRFLNDHYRRRLDERIQSFINALEPVLILIIGIIIAIMVGALYLPILELV